MDMFGKQIVKQQGKNLNNITTKKHRYKKSFSMGIIFAVIFLCLIFIGKAVLPYIMEIL